MKSFSRRLILVLAALAVVFASSPAAKIRQLAWLDGYPGLALAILVAGVVVGFLLPPEIDGPTPISRPDDQNLADSQQRLNAETTRVAESVLEVAWESGPFVDTLAPLRAGQPVPVGPGRVRAVLLGEGGSGKSTFLARLAAEHATNDGTGPVALLRFGDWMDPVVTPRLSAANQFEEWLVNILVARWSIQRQVARYWVEQDRLTLFLDGLDDLVDGTRDDAIRGFKEWLSHSPNRSVVVTLRTERGFVTPHPLDLEGWEMPDLEPKIVIERLEQTRPDYHILPEQCRAALVGALRRPLWLRFIHELPRTVPLAEYSDVRSYELWLVEQFTRAALDDDATGELRRVLYWMATSMHARRVVTFDLAVPTTLSLPPEGRWLGRTIQAAGLAAGSVPYTLVAGLAAGFGWGAVPLSVIYAAVMVLAGSSWIGKYVIAKLAPPRLLRSRRFNRRAVSDAISEAPLAFLRRLFLAAIIGLIVGALLLVGIANGVADDFDRPYVMWFGIGAMPLLISAFGAFRGGLLSGLILALIVGVSGSTVVVVTGGVVAGLVAAMGFAASEFGERILPFVFDQGSSLRRQLTKSAAASVPYDIITWILVGLVYGTMMFAVSRDRVWFDYGVLLGFGGALVWFLVAFSWPPATAYALRAGLRRSGVLRRLTLDEALAELERRRVLTPVVGGASFRFFHPVFQEQMRAWTGTAPEPEEAAS